MRGRDQQMYQPLLMLYIYTLLHELLSIPEQRLVSSHTKYRVACCSNALILIKVHCGY